MAMELWVLSDRQLRSIVEWQTAIDAEGFPLQLSAEVSFADLSGFLPATLRGQTTGFECTHLSAAEFIRDMPRMHFGHDWKHVLACRWRGDFNELRAAWIAGAAYARATEGIIFDDQEGKIRNAEQAVDTARKEFESPDPDTTSTVDQILRDLKMGPYRK
jgi:hypothetical protein